MKKNIYLLILSLAVLSGLVFASREIKREPKASANPVCNAAQKAPLTEKEIWEASPAGIRYKEWELSPAGRKVHASHDKIRKCLTDSISMEAVVTAVTFEQTNMKSRPKWLIVKIKGEAYMMQFIPAEFELLKSLKVNDKIIVRSRGAGYSPNHPYLIISADYIEHNNKVLFKTDPGKNKGC